MIKRPMGIFALIEAFASPELSAYSGAEPAVIEVRPTLAPVFTDDAGPNGELAELLMGALSIEIVAPLGRGAMGVLLAVYAPLYVSEGGRRWTVFGPWPEFNFERQMVAPAIMLVKIS